MNTIPPGRHPNYCRCRECRRDVAQFESGLMKFDIAAVAIIAAIAGIIWVALAPLRIWHVIGADGQEHPDGATWIAYGISGGIILAAMMFLSIRATRETPREAAEKARIARPPRSPLPVEVLRPPPVATRPACLHLNAVPVDNILGGEPWAWLCPQCNAELPAESGRLMRPCCGTAPGDRHMYNCPHRLPARL